MIIAGNDVSGGCGASLSHRSFITVRFSELKLFPRTNYPKNKPKTVVGVYVQLAAPPVL